MTRTIAIAGPKGGIGRTTSAVTLGRALAAKGRHTIIVDTAPHASDAAVFLELDNAAQTPVHTCVDDLDFAWYRAPSVDDAFMRRFAQYDDVVFDCAGGFDDTAIRLFVRADFPILLTSPEPAAIRQTTSWIRRSFVASVPDHCRDVVRALGTDWTFADVSVLPATQRNAFCDAVSQYRCGIVLNHRREQNEIYQSQALCHAWGILLGVDVRFLGSIAADDRRWFFARNLADVSLLLRDDPIVRDWDYLVRSALDDAVFADPSCLPMLRVPGQSRKYLRVQTVEEARSAYRMLWEGYRRENGFVASILAKDEIARTISQLEIAYRNADEDTKPHSVATSGDSVTPSAVSRSGLSTVPASSPTPLASAPALSIVPTTSATTPIAATTPTITTTTPTATTTPSMPILRAQTVRPTAREAAAPNAPNATDAGAWIAQLRASAGLSLLQLAMRTRISPKLLEKLETGDTDGISRAHLVAYLGEIATVLRLPEATLRSKFGLA